MDGVPDIDQLRPLSWAIVGKGVGSLDKVVEHVLGIIAGQAGPEESTTVLFIVVASQGAKSVNDKPHKVVGQEGEKTGVPDILGSGL